MGGCDVENSISGREGVARLGVGNVVAVIIELREFGKN